MGWERWSIDSGVNKAFYSKEFASDVQVLGDVLDNAFSALLQRKWVRPDDELWTRLCLEEAVVNAIHHGNGGEDERKVKLEMAEEGENCCQIRVYDEGKGFSLGSVPDPDCEQLGGRGICLIRYYMDTVDFDCKNHCLEMTFRRKADGCCKTD